MIRSFPQYQGNPWMRAPESDRPQMVEQPGLGTTAVTKMILSSKNPSPPLAGIRITRSPTSG
jgi:hypothetical protein